MWPEAILPRAKRRPHDLALIQQCLEEVANGTSVNAVAKSFGIPRTTLLYHMKRRGMVSSIDRHGARRQTTSLAPY